MSLVTMRTLTSLMKFFGIRKDAEAISLSLDGKCLSLDCKVDVLEYEEVEVKGKKTKLPKTIKYIPLNGELRNAQHMRADSSRIIAVPAPSLYSQGFILPSQTIFEPEVDNFSPSLILKLNDPSREFPSGKGAIRIYVLS